jgi:hypothetical protein
MPLRGVSEELEGGVGIGGYTAAILRYIFVRDMMLVENVGCEMELECFKWRGRVSCAEGRFACAVETGRGISSLFQDEVEA